MFEGIGKHNGFYTALKRKVKSLVIHHERSYPKRYMHVVENEDLQHVNYKVYVKIPAYGI